MNHRDTEGTEEAQSFFENGRLEPSMISNCINAVWARFENPSVISVPLW